MEALTSDRYLFELADYDALDQVLEGGLRACQIFADEAFQPAVFAFPSHISGTAKTSKGDFKTSEADLLKALDIRSNLKPLIEDYMASTLNSLGVLYNSLRTMKRLESASRNHWPFSGNEIPPRTARCPSTWRNIISLAMLFKTARIRTVSNPMD